MKNKHIENLLEKYFEGETSLEEEKSLRIYFTETLNIPPHLEKYQALFQFFTAEIDQALDPSFDQAVLEAISEVKPIKASRIRFLAPLYRIGGDHRINR